MRAILTLTSCLYFSTHSTSRKAVLVEKDIPLEVDTGFLTVTDLNPVDAESYEYVVLFVLHYRLQWVD